MEANSYRNRHITNFTESVDIMPTILEWLDLDVPRQCDGRSLLPFCRGEIPSDWRTEVHWEYDFRDVSDPTLEKELGISMDQCALNVIRDEQFKYVHFNGLPPLFFNLEDDPDSLKNLVGDQDYGLKILEYAQKLLSWRMQNDERILTGMKLTSEGVVERQNQGAV